MEKAYEKVYAILKVNGKVVVLKSLAVVPSFDEALQLVERRDDVPSRVYLDDASGGFSAEGPGAPWLFWGILKSINTLGAE